jgi:hypothetical protein
MIEQGLIIEHPEGLSSKNGGRKPIPLSINKDYGYTIGIAIQSGHYSVVAVNLAGDILEIKEEKRVHHERQPGIKRTTYILGIPQAA